MIVTSSTILTVGLAVVALAVFQPVGAQEDNPQPVEARSATRPGQLPRMVFKNLPTTPIATIDGTPVTQADLIHYLIKGNWETLIQTLVLAGVLDIELKRAKITITERDIDEESGKIVQRLAPGKTVAETKALGIISDTELRRQALSNRGWDSLFMAERKQDPPGVIVEYYQLYTAQKMKKYTITQRGQDPGPPAGFIAEVRENDGAEVRRITADQALDVLIGMVRPEALRDAAEECVDSVLVTRQLDKAKQAVTESEVESWARSMRDKYSPPFDWRMICQFKHTTPDRERERWRRIQAWKRVTSWKVNEEELRAFLSDNADHFLGAGRQTQSRPAPADLKDPLVEPNYREWILDEYETAKMRDWVSGLRSRARIQIVSDEELSKLRALGFGDTPK